jgi:hypothetical protein
MLCAVHLALRASCRAAAATTSLGLAGTAWFMAQTSVVAERKTMSGMVCGCKHFVHEGHRSGKVGGGEVRPATSSVTRQERGEVTERGELGRGGCSARNNAPAAWERRAGGVLRGGLHGDRSLQSQIPRQARQRVLGHQCALHRTATGKDESGFV